MDVLCWAGLKVFVGFDGFREDLHGYRFRESLKFCEGADSRVGLSLLDIGVR